MDDHYLEGGSTKSNCHKYPSKASQPTCGKYGVPGARYDSPYVLVKETMEWIDREWRDKLDFVIWTGDNASRNTTAMMVDLFSTSIKGRKPIPVIPVIGNNDIYRHNHIRPNDPILISYEQLWHHWIPKNQRDNFIQGGYFAVDVAPGLRILSLNTLYFVKKNPYSKNCYHKKSPGYIHLNWYKNELRKARKDGVKVYVIGHGPPTPDDFRNSCFNEYLSISSWYTDTIYGHFYSHLNMDHFLLYDSKYPESETITITRNVKKYVYCLRDMYSDVSDSVRRRSQKTNTDPIVVIQVAPSVYPVYLPTVRIYRYEIDDHFNIQNKKHSVGRPLDYLQYMANISHYNQHKDNHETLEYQLEYSFRSLYKVPDLSVRSYIQLADKLVQPSDSKDQPLWSVYVNNMFIQTMNDTFDSLK
ncbi:Metallo-dependent phosphatase-like protein [Pilobolus umbonatus]|nr:Metallo-dependent phosphatase-like protein [Pilobolus umbonatus]